MKHQEIYAVIKMINGKQDEVVYTFVDIQDAILEADRLNANNELINELSKSSHWNDLTQKYNYPNISNVITFNVIDVKIFPKGTTLNHEDLYEKED